ncbi:UNVERIFIED_CONTAM: hypothetical protein PYX00_010841 [Menopon gallinae]|uniref:Cyclic nucleotide-binding domain-containing protein n=1 Tax=Menopon gallinae TaxID=328185 RepID=A0AAW2H793_9NEOP
MVSGPVWLDASTKALPARNFSCRKVRSLKLCPFFDRSHFNLVPFHFFSTPFLSLHDFSGTKAFLTVELLPKKKPSILCKTINRAGINKTLSLESVCRDLEVEFSPRTYEAYVAKANRNPLMTVLLIQNRCLRLYKIILLLNAYDLTFRTATGSYDRTLRRHRNDIVFGAYQERMLVIICMACGLVLIYGDFIPYLLMVFMRVSLSQGEYYEKYLQLQRYLVNINVSPELTEQIQKYFRYFWNSGTTSIEMKELMQGLPLALKKQIFTDIYWEAFRHSDVFKPVSRCCKRSLSLHMKTQYCQEGEIIFAKNKVKPAMIYLVHGIMELMAEENENSPIMSFSSGTVLGEMSLFMLVKSLGIVKCRTICEIQTLSLRDAFRVMGDYPKDKNVIFQTLNKRIVVAKITQWRKRQINIEKMVGQGVSGGIEAQEDCVKWVKMQWRGIWEAHERHLLVTKAIEDGLRVPAWRKQYEVHIRLDMISNYMDLMVLSDAFEEKKDVVCLKTSFPWSIDPKAQFLKLWKVLVLACAVFASIAYPFCTAWLENFPTSIFTGSCVVTLVFEADLALLMMTAVKTKHGILTKFLSVAIQLLKKPTFYLDIIAAIPVQVADDLLTKVPIIYLAPLSLRRQVYKDTLFQTLKRCPMFVMESNDFIFDLIDKCNLVAVPAGTVLVDHGLKCYRIYLLHKGYCQVNSFLKNDISGGLGAPILLKPGHLFPTLAAFATIPAPVSIITLTDCEVVVVDLEDMLKTMVTHEVFHDIASVLLENNYIEKLSDHTFAMVRVNVQYNKPPNQQRAYNIPFKKLGCVGFILKCLLFNKQIFFDENQRPTRFLRIVDFCYILYLIVNALLWPLAFGLLTVVYRATILFLLSLNVLYLVYFYIQLHIPYFDHRGLLITHPLYTMLHYLTTSFPFDFFINFPIYLVYNVTISNFEEQDSEVLVFCVILQKVIAIVYINQYVDDKIRDSNYVSLLGPVKFFGILLIIMNAFANILMFASVDWEFDGPLNIIFFDEKAEGNTICGDVNVTDPIVFYTTITHWMFTHFTANYLYCHDIHWTQVVHANICSFVGWICTLAFYGWLASHSGAGDSSANLYHERMMSFLQFLRSSKAHDKAVENAVGYFEHQWAKTRGQNLLEICDNVPSHLLEELAYPLYRPTLSKITPFQNADESFFRLLSIHLELVHYNRGSIVLFKGQVQDDIFFIHRGKCFAYDWFVTLEMGSVIGDIKRTGVIDNKIYALTHVELLRIKSTEFYTILNNFYEIESSFKHLAETTENFIKTPYVTQNIQLRPVDSRDILNAFNLRSRELGFEDQSYFEDPENIATRSHIQTRQKVERKRFAFIIYPGTLPMVIYKIMISCVAFLTVVTMPALLFYASLTVEAFSIIATLDILWFLLTLTAFRIGVVDKIKGDIVTNYKILMKLYLARWDGFFLSLIACLPFEVIAITMADNFHSISPGLVGWLRAPRFIRGYYLIRSDKYDGPAQTRLGSDVSLLIVHENSLSLITSAKMDVIPFVTKSEILYFNVVVLVSIYVRGLIIKNILSIRYVSNVARGKYNSHVSKLETCLKRHELSLSIQKEVLDYKLNILIATRSENMPTFLLHSPDAIKLEIMTDLYLSRLTNSPIFKMVDLKFLRLVASRMKRAYYFAGQKIVEKGDVDYTMYFINKGEVYIADQTEGDAYVEYVVDHMFAGEVFGQLQGVAIAFPHKNTYIARTVVEMITLCSKDWFDLRQAYKVEFNLIIEAARKLY